jgi:hypothetical protein
MDQALSSRKRSTVEFPKAPALGNPLPHLHRLYPH